MTQDLVCMTFDDNALLAALFGEHDTHLTRLEERLNITAASRGNMVSLQGNNNAVMRAQNVLSSLYQRLERGLDVTIAEVEDAIRMTGDSVIAQTSEDKTQQSKAKFFEEEVIVKTPKKFITPHSHRQRDYIKKLYSHDMVFGVGPAGTGKTYLAVAVAVALFSEHKVDKIILSRPAVEAGEKIGFLPGDMKEKVDPYLQPLYDALHDMLPADKVSKYIETKVIEIAPLAFMRGRTLSNAFIILDEAQNATQAQMKMFMTRLGEGAKMAITGDPSQVDLPPTMPSGLADAVARLSEVKEIGMTKFEGQDIVRHPLVEKIVKAYDG